MASPWYLQPGFLPDILPHTRPYQPGFLPDILPDETGSPYQIARSSGMTAGNYPGMQTRFGHTGGNWDDIDARQRMDAARAYNQAAAQRNQVIEQQRASTPSADELLARQYRPTIGNTPGLAQIGNELLIGGKTVSNDIGADAAMLGMNPDELSGSLYDAQRVRAANAFRDYLSGNVPAGTAGRKLIDDPRFQGLDPQKQASIYQQAYGHGLEEDLQADLLSKSYGKPMTYADINSLKMREKSQTKDLGYLRAMSSMMGTRGELFEIANNPYDPKEGGVKYKAGQYDEPQVAHMTPEQHAILKQKFNQTLFPQALMPGQPQAAPTAQAAQQNPQHAPLTPEEQARLAAYHKRMLDEYRAPQWNLPALTDADRKRYIDFLSR